MIEGFQKECKMRLVTIQDKAAYDELCATGVLRCKAELAEWLSEDSFVDKVLAENSEWNSGGVGNG